MAKNNDTTIKLSQKTRDRLKKFGDKGDTYDFILNCLMDKAEKED